jgi:hypothetical protein
MKKDERDLLDVLKFELEFLEKGGYGRSPRAPWIPRYIFEDSPTCMNYDSKERPDPCSECVLMQLVPSEVRGAEIPCRHIPFNAEGETLDSLYRSADQYETEEVYGHWLRSTIATLEAQQQAQRDNANMLPAPSAAGSEGEPFFQNLHPKCANPACATAFHWLAGGKFFRFRPSSASAQPEARDLNAPTGRHEVKHFWLCAPCAHVFSLAYDAPHCVVLKLLRPELPAGESAKHLTAA